MQFVKLNNINIHFADTGNINGLPIVFSNSLGTDFRIWSELISVMKRDGARDCRFICYDKRGHGLTDAPNGPYQMADHVNDLISLMDYLEISDAIVIGLSVGGMITQSLSAKLPDRIRAIVLSNTGHIIGTKEIWDTRMNLIRQNGIASLSNDIMQRWFSKEFRDKNPAKLAAYRNMVERTPQEGYLGTCAAIRDCDLTNAAKSISVPTLLIGGSNDGATTPELMASTHSLIAKSRLEIIDGPGHLPCVEAPEKTAGIIMDFLKENDLV
ncbi:MAG: 3-oxoadipate enol-lactonase [Rhizobiaceae bacterium]|nr:3-oxoadipate enol-lactonase [Rhizobiaceae bacterium]